MALAVETRKDDARRKGFMSRVSSVLLPKKKTPTHSKTKHRPKSESLARREVVDLVENDHYSISSNYGPSRDHEEAEPGYSSVQDLHKVHSTKPSMEDSPPPPVPPKSLDAIYSCVKKRTKETSCNTEEVFSTTPLGTDEHQPSTSRKSLQPSTSHQKSKENKMRDVMKNAYNENSESSAEENEAVEELLKLERRLKRKSRLSKQKHKSTGSKSQKFSSSIPQPTKTHLHHPSSHHHHHHSKSSFQLPNPHKQDFGTHLPVNDSNENSIVVEAVNELKRKHREQLSLLQHEMRRTDEENTFLRAKVTSLLEEENKWKSEIQKYKREQQELLSNIESNAELNRRIAKLELDTRQEIQILSQRAKSIKNEKDLLMRQLEASQFEIEQLRKKYNSVCEEKQSMVSVERHVKSLEENKRFLEEMKINHEKEIAKLHQTYANIQEEKNSLSIQMVLMKESQKRIELENKVLQEKLNTLEEEKKELLQNLQNEKAQNKKMENLLTSLIRTSEQLTTEKEALLEKLQSQEEQRQKIHTTVIEHSINVGRMEEHIANMRNRMNEEIAKVVASNQAKEIDYDNMKESYERQLNFFRTALLKKNSMLDTLNKEKKQLEIDLENLWEATLVSKKQKDNSPHQNQSLNEKLNNML